jgi:hypothetical protein
MFPKEIWPVKGVERNVAFGMKSQVFIHLNKILHVGGRQTASWVKELTVHVLEELLEEQSDPSALSAAGAGEVAATQPPRPPSLRKNPRPSCKKSGTSEASATGSSSGHCLRADFALRHRPESSAVGSLPAAATVSTAEASADGPSVASTSSKVHPDISLLALVSELKRLGKLVDAFGNPLPLHQLFKEGCISVCLMLNQLYTYMVLTGVEFGFLSCFYFTWIAWRPLSSPDCLHLSGPFKHDTSAASGGVTTMAALSWIQDLAMQRTIGQAIRHAPYVRPAATGDVLSPETSDVKGDEDDSHDEDWENSGGGDQDSGNGSESSGGGSGGGRGGSAGRGRGAGGGGGQDSGDGGVGGCGGHEARDVPSVASMGGDRGSKRYVNGDSWLVSHIVQRKRNSIHTFSPYTRSCLPSLPYSQEAT